MNRKKLILLVIVCLCLELSGLQAQSVKDIDGNIYATTVIGNAVWMAENLKTTKYSDGTSIPLVTDDKKWGALKTPAYCWFNNNIENKEEYGALYNWFAVDTKKLCPTGWHVPSNAEWGTMVAVSGDEATAGSRLRETGMEHWNNALVNATNDFDFTALPAGFRSFTGEFPPDGNNYAIWWTTTAFDAEKVWNRGLYFNSSRLFNGYRNKKSGFSVRCVKDGKK
jgi:uncharacterized protein (TIGR02145 family)